MNTITIKQSELITELSAALNGCIGTDWDIYVDRDGNVDCRHSTYDNGEWAEIIDMYGMECYEDDGKFPGDDGFDYDGIANYIVEDLCQQISATFDVDVDDEEVKFDVCIES